MAEESIWPKLQPLPNNIRQVIFGDTTIFISDKDGNRLVAHSPQNSIEHFNRNSARYNGVLSISATGVDNDKAVDGSEFKVHMLSSYVVEHITTYHGQTLLEEYITSYWTSIQKHSCMHSHWRAIAIE